MIFRIAIACVVLAAGFALYKIYSIQRYYAEFREPLASFTIREDGNQSALTIVEFLNYDCGGCKDTHLVLLDYADKNPNIQLVVRPVPFANGGAEDAAERALAAGLQGKFWEMDRALSEYKGVLDERFYRESAALYNIDYERMLREAEERSVQEMAKNNVKALRMAGFKTMPGIIVGKTFYELDEPLTLGRLISMVEAER